MLLNAKNLGLAGGVIWSLCIFICTLVSLPTGYAKAFLDVLVSIYPGYQVSWAGSFLGLFYGFVDGFLGLFILAWIYNKLEERRSVE